MTPLWAIAFAVGAHAADMKGFTEVRAQYSTGVDGWGSAFMVNPTDLFPQVLFLEPWRPRAGVNAARASIHIGDAHRLQLVAGSDDDFQAPRLATRGTVNLLQTEWLVIGAWRPEADDGLVGVGIKGTLGVGFSADGAWHLRETDPGVFDQVGLRFLT